MHELFWLPEADDTMGAIEAEPERADILRALRRTLGRLELDPDDPTLGTRMFASKEFEHIRATPARVGDWWVLWTRGPEPGSLVIVHVGEIPL